MSDLKREFYEVDGVAKLLDLSLSDIWYLIEIGKIDASFRQIMADTTITFEDFTIHDFLANPHTYLIPFKSAKEIALKGSCVLKQALIYLAEPKEELMIDPDGEEFIGCVDTTTLQLLTEIAKEAKMVRAIIRFWKLLFRFIFCIFFGFSYVRNNYLVTKKKKNT